MTLRYGVELSFDSEELSRHSATLNRSFSSFSTFLDTILDELPFAWELLDGVYVIYPQEIEPPKPLLGVITDRESGEPLPFAYIDVNGVQVISDEKGSFSLSGVGDGELRVAASYLGYYKIDTLVNRQKRLEVALTPAPLVVDEVVIKANIIERATQVGEEAGLITVNQQIASYLPGNGDDAIFNLLRVQPGVLASGEQSSDLILWGSPEGTSRTYFDGMALWGLSNFSDNISTINPYMVSRIDLYRGGYDVSSPDAAGGVANIRSKMGNANKFSAGIFLNNETVNGVIEVPIGKKSILMAAYRMNYYDLLGVDDIRSIEKLEENRDKVIAIPDYKFRDYNLKYTFRGDNNDLFYISSLYATDRLSYDVSCQNEIERPNADVATRDVHQNAAESNDQFGVSAYYGKTWESGVSSSITASYSHLHNNYDFELESNGEVATKDLHTWQSAQNNISELSVKNENRFRVADIHSFNIGAEYTLNSALLREDSLSVNHINNSRSEGRYTLFAEDDIALTSTLNLALGVRTAYYEGNGKWSADPRISLHYKPLENLRFNAAWGLYHQYVVETSVSNEAGGYTYSWNLADGEQVPVIESQHVVAGVAYTPKNYIFTIDGYYKNYDELTRYVAGKKFSETYHGIARTYGLDLFAKRGFRGGSAIWLSYSLAKNEEKFDHYKEDRWVRSPQDVRHELKTAGIWRIGDFHLSATYIFGSGFPTIDDIATLTYTEQQYHRLDVSAVYSFRLPWMSGNVGVSILNVTGNDNQKYNNFSRLPQGEHSGITIDSGSTPFTPLVYLKLAF